jgi:hypothetical protein
MMWYGAAEKTIEADILARAQRKLVESTNCHAEWFLNSEIN